MGNMLTPDDIDLLINQSVASLPGEPTDPLRLQQESATEWLMDEIATALSMRRAPDLKRIERQIATELSDQELPQWLTLSRVVLVVRDAMRHPTFQRTVDRLPAAERYSFYDNWAELAASLYHDYPDDQIAGKPAMAINLLAGQSKPLRKSLAGALSMELKGTQKRGLLDGLRAVVLRSAPNKPHRSQPTNQRAERSTQPEFDPSQGIKRPSGTPRLDAKRKRSSANGGAARTSQSNHPNRQAPRQHSTAPQIQPRRSTQSQQERPARPAAQHQAAQQRPATAPVQSRAPAAASGRSLAPRQEIMVPAPQPGSVSKPVPMAPISRAQAPIAMAQRMQPMATQTQSESATNRMVQAKPPARGMRAFEAAIEARFASRGLAPIAITTAAMAAIVMAENVRDGRAPEFYEVEYEVLARSGEAVAPGAVRTWTLHAFMECMRDDWFRDLFHALPSQARAETVWVWAKAAAEWFDVPAKLREFWVRALSGGDPVLAAAASRAFAAKTPQLPTRPTAAPLAPPAPAVATYAMAPQSVMPRAISQTPLPASAAQLIGQTINKPTGGDAASAPMDTMQPRAVESLGPANPTSKVPVQQASVQQAPSRQMPTTGMTAPRPSGNLMMGGMKRSAPLRQPTLQRAALQQTLQQRQSAATQAPQMPVRQPQIQQTHAQHHRPMAAKPPVQSPVFDRQTPRPEPVMASAMTMARPLPKRHPVSKSDQATKGVVPMGAADIYYGASSDDSPMVPRDLSQMETIGSGD